VTQHRPRELPRRHGLAEQKSLYQIETEFAGDEEVGACLNPLSDGARAIALGECNDLTAYLPL